MITQPVLPVLPLAILLSTDRLIDRPFIYVLRNYLFYELFPHTPFCVFVTFTNPS